MTHLKSLSSKRNTTTTTTLSPTQRILQWNKKRNNLKYDIDLETKMLTEEANEFFVAETLVDRLDAFADFAFVAIGTAMKYMAVKHKDFHNLDIDKADFEALSEYINTVQSQMGTMLYEEVSALKTSMLYEDENGDTDLSKLLEDVLLIVISANEAKGFELNADGKVMKPEGFVKPEAQIDNLLKKTLGANYVPYVFG